MEYRENKALDARVSLLGFGCMRLPTDGAGRVLPDEARRIVLQGLDAGVNYLDTAYFYLDGRGEESLGRCLEGVPRERYYLATKLPCSFVNSGEDARRVFAEQQARLRTDYFDFYLLHALKRENWEKTVERGILDWCLEQQRRGAIRRLGFSFHDDYEVFEEILTYRRWDFCQIQLNYLDTDIQAGLRGYRLAEGLGVPVVVMEPVKGGALADPPEDVAALLRQAGPEASPASWALRWVGSLPGVLTVLSGMTTAGQVEDNVKTFSPFRPLDGGERAAVERAAQALRARSKNGCTGCGYCMPCPAGVDIRKNFDIWNIMARCGDGAAAWRPWNVVMAEGKKGKNCVRCGRCVPLCPQGIPIPDDLARAQAELDSLKKPNR